MDCIILAGNRDDYRAFSEKPNKAFLEIQGQTILQRMLAQVEKVEAIDRFLLVGPKAQIESHLKTWLPGDFRKPVLVFEQGSDLVNNIEEVLQASQEGADADRYVLILPSDIPLLIAPEVEQFIEQCDMSRYDMVSGLTTEKALSAFYPEGEKPGVKMAYFCFKNGKYRINNMHMIRPAAMLQGHYIRKTYAMRYQKEWTNILRMMFNLLKVLVRNPDGLFIYVGMSLARYFNERGYHRCARFLSKRFPIERAARSISKVLKLRFKIAVTHLGGAAIDVDNASDFEAVAHRYQEWINRQLALAKTGEHIECQRG